ncbi:MAG: DUF3999 domain-containing protein [Dokdonella sp.]
MKALAMLALELIGLSAQASTPSQYAIVIPINTKTDSAAWQVELDASVYTWSRDSALRDMRVFNADGIAVPMQTWQAAKRDDDVTEQRADLILIELPALPASPASSDLSVVVERGADGRLRRIEANQSTSTSPSRSRDWLLDCASFESAIDRLRLHWSTPDNGVIARFAIEASDDLQRWRTLRDEVSIVLLHQDGARIDHREIPLDGNRSKYLRLRRLDDGPELVGLRAEALRERRQHGALAPLQWLQAHAIETTVPSAEFEYGLAASIPVSAVRVQLGTENALAQLVLSSGSTRRNGETNGQPLARLVAYRLRHEDRIIDSGELTIGTTSRVQTLTLTAAAPIAVAPRLSVGWRPARIVFLSEGRGPFVLAVGHADERRVDAELGNAMSALRATLGAQWQPPLATLGIARQAAGEMAFTPLPEATPWRRWLLWIVLIGAAALVSAIALSLLRGQR